MVATWRCTASSNTGWPCPCTAVHHDAMPSRTWISAPSRTTVSQAPLALRTTVAGGVPGAPMVLYGCQTWAVSMALISAGVNRDSFGTDTERSPRRSPGVLQRGWVHCQAIMMFLTPTRPEPATAPQPVTPAAMGTRKSGFYRHDLDGLRGVAIALVAVFHVWFGRVSGGVD